MITEFKIINSLEGIHDLQKSLEKIASSWDLTKTILFEVNIILEELCANYIEHVGDEKVSFLNIQLSSDESNLSITVSDNGPPFDPTKVPAPDISLPPEQRQAGGIGLHLVRHYTDEILYSRKNGKNIVYMEKKLA